MNLGVSFRLATLDDVPVVRKIVNDAYKRLGDMGLNYTGVYQDEEETKKRMEGRDVYLAVEGERVVGTVCLKVKKTKDGGYCLYLNQMAVLPEYQRKGIGSLLMELAEKEAERLGQSRLQLDTAIPAVHLIEFYAKRGYAKVDEAQWEGKTYRSVVMEKVL